MRTINPNVYPKGGFTFKESDGTLIAADSWSGVVVRVVRYRKRAKLEPGRPYEEVMTQACDRNPGLCRDDTVYTEQLKVSNLRGRILKWLSTLVGKEHQFVNDAEHRRRAAICARCPKNKALPSGCAVCSAALKEYRERIIGGRYVDGRLNACSVLGEYLPVSSHLEGQAEDNAELPGECWRKRTI